MAATSIIVPMTETYDITVSDSGHHIVNILLTSFAGLALPRTLSLPVDASTPIRDVLEIIYARLPPVDHPLVITTTSNKQLHFSQDVPILTLLSSSRDTFLPLRLSARLCGGKGGFGSQLRAAGGRMSSRKSRQQNQQQTNGSNRNLDGRRLRTVDEAKKLAEYLAIKPNMERKEKEERKKRWEAVVEAAERREEEIKQGGKDKGRLDAEWVDGKEMAEQKMREAVLRAMRENMVGVERTGSESSPDAEGQESEEEEDMEASSVSSDDARQDAVGNFFFGWEDDDDDDDDDEEEEEEELDEGQAKIQPKPAYEGKGKAKAS